MSETTPAMTGTNWHTPDGVTAYWTDPSTRYGQDMLKLDLLTTKEHDGPCLVIEAMTRNSEFSRPPEDEPENDTQWWQQVACLNRADTTFVRDLLSQIVAVHNGRNDH